MTENNVFLSIIIPTYNEEVNIATTLQDISEYLRNKNFIYELIISDDGSTDDTVNISEGFKGELSSFKVIGDVQNRGKGYAVRKGIESAVGEYILFMDADNSTRICEFDKFEPVLNGDYDIITATRRVPGAEAEVSMSRRILGTVYVFLSWLILGLKVSDPNCGFKIFKIRAARKLFSKQVMNDWSFDAEVFFLSRKSKFMIKEIPVTWIHKHLFTTDH